MNVSFNELDQKILRYLEKQYLVNGSGPETMHDPVTTHDEIIAEFKLEPEQYVRIISRYKHYGIIDFNPALLDAVGGHIQHIDPVIVEIVHQLDEEAKAQGEQQESQQSEETEPEQINQYEALKNKLLSHPIIAFMVIVFAVVAAILGVIGMIKNIWS